MRIGVVSDTHNNYRTVEAVVGILRKEQVGCVLHCGDIEDERTVLLFEGLPTHFVYGNCDGEKLLLRSAIESSGATIQEPFGHLDLQDCKLAWIHGDDKR
jgi:putative phosphoesterase